jgi:hypothetical protein
MPAHSHWTKVRIFMPSVTAPHCLLVCASIIWSKHHMWWRDVGERRWPRRFPALPEQLRDLLYIWWAKKHNANLPGGDFLQFSMLYGEPTWRMINFGMFFRLFLCYFPSTGSLYVTLAVNLFVICCVSQVLWIVMKHAGARCICCALCILIWQGSTVNFHKLKLSSTAFDNLFSKATFYHVVPVMKCVIKNKVGLIFSCPPCVLCFRWWCYWMAFCTVSHLLIN